MHETQDDEDPEMGSRSVAVVLQLPGVVEEVVGHLVAMRQEVGEEEEEGSSHDLEEGLQWAIIKTVNTAKLRTHARTHTPQDNSSITHTQC